MLDAAHAAGLSGGGRLHDLFVSIEAMTPDAFKRGGAELLINYGFATTLFGQVIVANTPMGICHMAFAPTADLARDRLNQKFPAVSLHHSNTAYPQQALMISNRDWSCRRHIKLHLQASRFLIKTWEALFTIPMGAVASYGDVARHFGQPSASRAVPTAIVSKPVAFK